ncbi:MAG: hypothetical protein SOR91_09825 [Hornefia butyriciproducens]|jgi:hypothetical protein|uniref:hypothetical protein n=1 Tax=Hornefia butyriciproducens TaxID=2652293 RepID=UPI002A759B9B|nr:hypothetical protein [Hornefia butyriciproducens]MDY2991753.1 hypothetical protein [Hornefia butyriciproducens]MDY5463206.1 hypothetical protein [Hornefia butyriciproducens]
MSNYEFRTFPSDPCQALAIIYLQNQDLHDFSPKQLYDQYQTIYNELKTYSKRQKADRSSQRVKY